jgi:hypothetical protein
MKLRKREDRRDRSWRYGVRARREWLRSFSYVWPDRVPQRTPWYYEKRKSLGCNCRHREHGNPKYGIGICVHCVEVRPAVRERIDGKRYCHRWLKRDEE